MLDVSVEAVVVVVENGVHAAVREHVADFAFVVQEVVFVDVVVVFVAAQVKAFVGLIAEVVVAFLFVFAGQVEVSTDSLVFVEVVALTDFLAFVEVVASTDFLVFVEVLALTGFLAFADVVALTDFLAFVGLMILVGFLAFVEEGTRNFFLVSVAKAVTLVDFLAFVAKAMTLVDFLVFAAVVAFVVLVGASFVVEVVQFFVVVQLDSVETVEVVADDVVVGAVEAEVEVVDACQNC